MSMVQNEMSCKEAAERLKNIDISYNPYSDDWKKDRELDLRAMAKAIDILEGIDRIYVTDHSNGEIRIWAEVMDDDLK